MIGCPGRQDWLADLVLAGYTLNSSPGPLASFFEKGSVQQRFSKSRFYGVVVFMNVLGKVSFCPGSSSILD